LLSFKLLSSRKRFWGAMRWEWGKLESLSKRCGEGSDRRWCSCAWMKLRVRWRDNEETTATAVAAAAVACAMRAAHRVGMGEKLGGKKNANSLCIDEGNTPERPYAPKRPSITRSVVQRHVFFKFFFYLKGFAFFSIFLALISHYFSLNSPTFPFCPKIADNGTLSHVVQITVTVVYLYNYCHNITIQVYITYIAENCLRAVLWW